jgi:hypothetical protein
VATTLTVRIGTAQVPDDECSPPKRNKPRAASPRCSCTEQAGAFQVYRSRLAPEEGGAGDPYPLGASLFARPLLPRSGLLVRFLQPKLDSIHGIL